MMPLKDEGGLGSGLPQDSTGPHRSAPAAEAQRADAEFLHSVLASSADCIKVLDLDGKIIFMNEGGFAHHGGDDFASVLGHLWPDFWAGEERSGRRHFGLWFVTAKSDAAAPLTTCTPHVWFDSLDSPHCILVSRTRNERRP